jgi:hypothetical protein
MDPCIATGAAAALDLAGAGSVDQIDNAALRERVKDNVERTDQGAHRKIEVADCGLLDVRVSPDHGPGARNCQKWLVSAGFWSSAPAVPWQVPAFRLIPRTPRPGGMRLYEVQVFPLWECEALVTD